MSLRVVKEREYVWRVNLRFSHEAHAWITGWAVYDGNQRVYGGFLTGNNHSSGSAHCPTRREALAFVAGWDAYKSGAPVSRTDAHGTVYADFDACKHLKDDGTRDGFRNGVFEAGRRERTVTQV